MKYIVDLKSPCDNCPENKGFVDACYDSCERFWKYDAIQALKSQSVELTEEELEHIEQRIQYCLNAETTCEICKSIVSKLKSLRG